MDVDILLRDMTIVIVLGALLSWASHALRQPIILGYILCGVLAGPGGFGWVSRIEFVDAVGRIGVTLLLFLAGVTLHPYRLVQLFRETAWITLGTCAGAFLAAGSFALACGYGATDSLLIAAALMFSSTILVIKLLPTTTLHQKHMGAACIAILIAQDLIAVWIMLFISPSSQGGVRTMLLVPVVGALLLGAAFLAEQYILRRMMARCDRLHEVLYLLSLAWCLGLATAAHMLGLSYEVGAFLAGLALARSPLSLFLSEGLKPFRDFFLVLFFFVLGARLDVRMLWALFPPAALLAALLLALKPWLFARLFRWVGETRRFAREAGLRLGQASEFSLVIAAFAAQAGRMSESAAQFAQLTAILTMAVSAYLVVLRCPTPVASQPKLQRD